MLALLLELLKGAIASVAVVGLARMVGWSIDHIEVWFPTTSTFSYHWLKEGTDTIGNIAGLIIILFYTGKGLWKLFGKERDRFR